MPALDGYCSPNLRKAVHDRMYPGSVVEYEVITMAEAFPEMYRAYRGEATHAIRCTVIHQDGSYVVGMKEIDRLDERSKREIELTPEQYAKDQTKALGRAMRDAGIPQKVDELQSLMRWLVALDGRPVTVGGRTVDTETGEMRGSDDPDVVDDPDAGNDEPTTEQKLAARVSALPGADKVMVSNYAKEQGVNNVMKAGEKAEEILAFVERMHADRGDPE